jgi:hypothetical protein
MDSMLAAIEHTSFKPQYLGSLGLFSDEPSATRAVTVEARDSTLSLIPTSPIGAPLPQLTADARKLRTFMTTRLAKGSRIMAEEVQGVRAFGSTSELQQVQELVARRLQRLRDDMELTHEHHRLGAVQGILLDADGSTLVNYFTEFGVQQPAVVEFDFTTLEAGEVRALIEGSITRPMIRAAQGAFVTGSRIIALCGDDFWDGLVNHAEVRQTYINWQAAMALREATAFSTFPYAGVDWVNYRGTDDNSTVAISSSDAKFFIQAPGIFQVAWAPAEFIDTVNRPGVPLRPMVVPDPSGRNAFVDVEVYSYPLFFCTRPKTLYRATLST